MLALCRVLVVDGDRDAVDTLGRLFEFAGHEVHRAYDGIEAVTRIRSVRPNVVIADLRLAGVGAWEVARAAIELLAQRPLLIGVTALALREAHQMAGDLTSFDHILKKPYEWDKLLRLVADYRSRQASS